MAMTFISVFNKFW